MVLAPVVRGRKGEYGKLFDELRAEGFTRVKVDGELRRLEEDIVLDKKYKHDISVVIDRLVMRPDLRKRLADSIETAVGRAEGIVDIENVETERGHHLLGAVHVPPLRHLDARARAADVLVQLAARRLPALHRARLADGDRPRADRAGPVAVAERRRDPAVVHEQLELLRADDTGDRGQVGGRPRPAVGGPRRGRPQLLPVRHERRPDLHLVPEPVRAQALVHHHLRGHRPEPRAPLPRDRLGLVAREDRGVHDAAAVPRVQRRAAAAGVAGGHGRRARDRRVHEDVRAPLDRVARAARAVGHRARDRPADPARDRRAAPLPRQRGRGLPVARARGRDAVGRRGAAHPARHPDRLVARGRAVHPRRAVDRPAPARQRAPDRHARAAARPRQHRDRGRARRGHDARGRPPRGPRSRRRRARRAPGRRRDPRRRAPLAGLAHRPVPLREALDPDSEEAPQADRLHRGPGRGAAQPQERST